MRFPAPFAATLLAVTIATPRFAAAQTRFDFTPDVGFYVPLSNAVNENGVTLKNKVSYVIGASAAVWVNAKTGIELSMGYSGSGITVNDNGSTADTTGHVFLGSLRVLYGLSQGTSGCFEFVKGAPAHCLPALYLTAGLGLVSRGGDGWSGVTGTSNISGVLGIGYRVPLNSTMAVRLEGEVFLYSAAFGESGVSGTTTSEFQEDFVFSAGLAIPLGGR